MAVFEQVVSVERAGSWTGEIPCVCHSKGQQSVAVCHHMGLPAQGQALAAGNATHSSVVSEHSPGHRISPGISQIILQCWLMDCFCVSWKSQLKLQKALTSGQ